MRLPCAGAATVALLLALPAAAQAPVELVEHLEGPSRSDVVLGNGRLTVVASSDGVFTALRWPSPAHFDQLHHVTATGLPMDQDAHALPRLGAAKGDGMWLGVRIQDAAGSRVWSLDDPALWHKDARWLSDTSRTAVWTAANDEVELQQQAFVIPDRDVLVISLLITPKAPLVALDALLYAHPAQSAHRLPALPIADFWLDAPDHVPTNHFLTARDDAADAIVCVAPEPLLEALAWERAQAAPDATSALAAVEDVSAVAMALGADRPTLFQVGSADDGVGALRPLDALADVQDGSLAGNRLHLGDGTVALLAPLAPSGASQVTFFVALAGAPSAALSRLSDARALPAGTLRDDVEHAALVKASSVALPDTADAAPRTAALRALIALDMLQDTPTGAVVSSAATQPGWGVDRAVDAAFVDVAWAQSGQVGRALAHRVLWSTWQRAQADGDGPAGTIPGAVYPDGQLAALATTPSDALALMLWAHTLVVQQGFVSLDLVEPTRALGKLQPGAHAALEFLLTCVDDAGLPCPAHAWDQAVHLQSLWQLATAVAAVDVGTVFAAQQQDPLADLAATTLPVWQAALDARLLEEAAAQPLHVVAFALGAAHALQSQPDARAALLANAIQRARDAVTNQAAANHLPLAVWLLLRAAKEDGVVGMDAVVDALVETCLTPFGHVGARLVPGPQTPQQQAGTPAALDEAALYLALLERHGRALPPNSPVPDLPTCDCTSSSPRDAWLGGLLLCWILWCVRHPRVKKLPAKAGGH